MKYQQPAGEAADASYVDGNRAAGVRGSVPAAKAIEAPMRELVHLIAFAGLTPSEGDNEQVRKAIEALIAAATGGTPAGYILMDQARARLPVFPEILTADGKMIVTSPGAGTILVPAAVTFQHRGIFPVSTSDYDEATERTFATSANRTYHLRWTPLGGFALKDIADGAYNPGVLAETDSAFDTSYDDMLVARVQTDPGNIATVINLVNSNRLLDQRQSSGAAVATNPDNVAYTGAFALNWARRPKVLLSGSLSFAWTGSTGVGVNQNTVNQITIAAQSRYGVTATISLDIDKQPASGTGILNLMAVA